MNLCKESIAVTRSPPLSRPAVNSATFATSFPFPQLVVASKRSLFSRPGYYQLNTYVDWWKHPVHPYRARVLHCPFVDRLRPAGCVANVLLHCQCVSYRCQGRGI
jgi:hypothetical protein